MPENKSGSKKIIIVVVCAILVAIVAVAVLIGVVLPKIGKSEVKPLYDKNNNPVYIDNKDVKNIYSDSDKYKGKFIDIGGQVFSIKKEKDVTIYQIDADTGKIEDNMLIFYKEETDIQEDDYIKVTGYIIGDTEYTNALDEKISSPSIKATKIEKSTYIEAVRPAIKTINFTDKVIDQSGYKIEITKVEFAEKETRLYLTFTNNAQSDFSVYPTISAITQNGKQYDVEYNDKYSSEYELNEDLKPGVTSSGILTFKPFAQKDFKYIIDGFSDDFEVDLQRYEFNVEVK